MEQGQIPAMEMMEGVALAFAGVLLITPGFITDTIGFLCLIPASRRAIIRYILARASVHSNFAAQSERWQSGQHYHHHESSPKQKKSDHPKVGRTIEGEFHRED